MVPVPVAPLCHAAAISSGSSWASSRCPSEAACREGFALRGSLLSFSFCGCFVPLARPRWPRDNSRSFFGFQAVCRPPPFGAEVLAGRRFPRVAVLFSLLSLSLPLTSPGFGLFSAPLPLPFLLRRAWAKPAHGLLTPCGSCTPSDPRDCQTAPL